MSVPALTRHRRPFFAPVWASLLGLLAVAGIVAGLYASASTTVVVLARAAPVGPAGIADAPLSNEGELAAARLAALMGVDGADADGAVRALYVTQARAAQQTAALVGARLRLQPALLPGADAEAIAARVLHEHGGERVVLIGSGDLMPKLLREFGVSRASAADEAEALYIISIPSFGPPGVMRLKY